MSLLANKTALITGGTTGIGLATAHALHAAGARVLVTGANADTLAAARRELPEAVAVLRADVRSLADTAAIAKEVEQRFGALDIAFLNAGIAQFAPLEGFDEAFYDNQMDVNVKGVLFTLQKVSPLLREGASIVLNTSVVAHKGVANASVYSATKGAVSALVRSLAVELAPRGIRVNAVSPGPIETPIYGKLGFPAAALEAFQAGMTAKVPLTRFGTANEVASAVVFLASPASAYLSGVELPVDGGLVIA